MKTTNIFLFCIFFFATNFLYPQDFEQGMLYVFVKDEIAIPDIELDDEKLVIILEDSHLAQTLIDFETYYFERAFPEVDSFQIDYKYDLERVYLLKCQGEENVLMTYLSENYSHYYDLIEMIPRNDHLLHTPNDYHLLDNIMGPNYALDIINAKNAWDITQGNSEVIIGLTESGCDLDHEDLDGKFAFVISNYLDNNPHGTFAAGIAAAQTNNNLGISSIGYNCSLGLDNGKYDAMLRIAKKPGVKVIHVAWGSCNYSYTDNCMVNFVSDLGILIVAAAGNGTLPNDDCNLGSCGSDCNGYFYPASYDRVMSVTSVGSDLSHISNFDGSMHTHNDKVDVCAPGYRVLSTGPNDEYWLSSGTSFAAPYVSGLAGLIFSINPNFTPEQVAYFIKSTTQNIDDLNPEFVGLIGTGLIDAYAAVQKADYIANNQGADYIIYDNESIVWSPSEIKVINNYIHIQDGGSLTINGEVYLKENAIIIVERGGILNLEGAYVTSFDNKPWTGIEVWGNYFADQDPEDNQGRLIISGNTLIESAKYAITLGKRENGQFIRSFGGGIVKANNSSFKNNGITVEFSPYQRNFGPLGLPNKSHFTECEFIYDRVIDYGFYSTFMILNSVEGINLLGCRFINNSGHIASNGSVYLLPYLEKYGGTGIVNNNSSFSVRPYINGTYVASPYFYNLCYGIKSYCTSSIQSFEVNNATFERVFYGIYTHGTDNISILNNDFHLLSAPNAVPDFPFSYGIYLDNSTGYRIENNQFLKFQNSAQLRNVIGIIVNNSGPNYNMIYNNYFDKQYIGILAQNHNRGWTAAPYTGLVIKCNDFYRNHFDISVTGDDEQPHYGIGIYQGVQYGVDGPAGNLFGQWRPGSTSDFHNEMQHINYIHHGGLSRLTPIYYTEQTISLIDANINWDPILSCPIVLPREEEEVKSLLISYEEEAYENKSMLESLVDHGDTYQLEADVLFSNPSQALDIYNYLLDAEGKLSKEVLTVAIQKEDVLVDAMIRDILVDNPHSVKSDDLLLLLENRINQLPEYMLAQIDQGYNLLSAKEELESKIAANELFAEILSNELISIYKADTMSPLASFDSLTAFLAQRQTPGSYYRLAFEYLDAGQLNDASATMLNIANFNLSDKQFEVYTRMTSYFNLLKNLRMQERDIYELQAEEVNLLTGLLAGSDMVAAYARSILIANDLINHNVEIILPTEGIKASRVRRNAAMPINKELSFYPNPASNYVIISYDTGYTGNQSNLLVISDLTGRMIKSIELGKHPADTHIIPLKGMNKGVYICTLYSGRQINSNTKLVVH